MLGKVKNKLIAVFAAVLLACGSIAAANLVNAPEEPSVFEPQEFIWVDAETAEEVSVENSEEADAVQTPYLEIYKINLSHDADTQLLYAVYNENFESTSYEVKLLVWKQQQEAYTIESIEEDENSYTVVTDKRTTIAGKDCLVFYTKGFPAKCYTDDVFVCAYVNVEGVEYYSEVRKFGVLEYVDSIRTKYADAVKDSKEAKTLDMLDAMLVYGAKAQIRFDYNTNRLASAAYYRVDVENGTLADGFNYGYYQAGETVTLQANPAVDANHTFERWVDENGATVSTNETLTVTLPAKDKTYKATYVGDGWTFIDRGTYYDISTFTGTYKDVEVPNTYRGKPVVSIIMNAFRGVTTMETLVIPENIKTIGATAFDGCTALKSVTLSEGLESIGKGAFDGCRNLKSIHIPSTVTQILDAYAPFYGCAAMENITVAAGNTAYSSINGSLYNANGSKLLRYAIAKADTTFVLPETVTAVGASAIRNAVRLAKIYIPASVVTIETHAIKNLAEGAVIYCQNVDNQSGWNANWNLDRYTVEAY